MTPYLLVLFVATTATYFGRVSGSVGIQRASLVAVAIFLICFAGFRDYHVGTDTGNYVYNFYRSHSLKEAQLGNMEFGYVAFVWLTRLLSDNYAVLLLSIAAIVVAFYLSTIVRFVDRYEFGVYLFIVFGSYTWLFNGARQAIAGAICFWALRFVINRRLVPYVACIAAAMLFHKTAIVALPIYFLATPDLKLKRLISLAAAIVLFAVFIRIFVGIASQFLDDRFAGYSAQKSRGGEVVTAYLTGEAGLFLWLRRRITVNLDLYDKFLNIYLVALVPAYVTVISSVDPSGLMRLATYFSGAEILLWPMIFREIRRTRQRALVGLSFLAVTIAYFILTTDGFANLTPYRMNGGLF